MLSGTIKTKQHSSNPSLNIEKKNPLVEGSRGEV